MNINSNNNNNSSDSDEPPPPIVHQVMETDIFNETRPRATTARQRWGQILEQAKESKKTPTNAVQWLIGQLKRNREERSEIDLLSSMGLRPSTTGLSREDSMNFAPEPPPLPPRPKLTPIHKRKPPPKPPKPQTFMNSHTLTLNDVITEEEEYQPSYSMGSSSLEEDSSLTTTDGSLYESAAAFEEEEIVIDREEELTSIRQRMEAIEEVKAASKIFTLYIKRGGLRELGIPNQLKNAIEKALESGKVSRTLFDNAQKHVKSYLRTETLPKYMQYIGESALAATNERLDIILQDDNKINELLDYCASVYTEENLLFYLAVDKFRSYQLPEDEINIGGATVAMPSTTTSVTPISQQQQQIQQQQQQQMSEKEKLQQAEQKKKSQMIKWPTLKHLVIKMVSASHENVEFRNSFLLTIHYFSSPPEVLDVLFEVLNSPPPQPSSQQDRLTVQQLSQMVTSKSRELLTSPELTAWKASKIRIFSVLKHWVKMYTSDFAPPVMERRLRNTLRMFPPIEWSHFGYNTGTLKVIAQSVLDGLENARFAAIKKKQKSKSIRPKYSVGERTPERSPSHLNSKSREHWVPDQVTNACMVCWSAFTFINRRHHCRNCGILVCGSCSSNSVESEIEDLSSPSNTLLEVREKTAKLLRLGKKKRVRVCDNCYEELTTAQNPAPTLDKQNSKVTLKLQANRATTLHNVLAKSLQENRSVDIFKISAQEMAFQLTLIAKRRMQDINGARDFMKVSDKWIKKLNDKQTNSNNNNNNNNNTKNNNIPNLKKTPSLPKVGRVANMRQAFESKMTLNRQPTKHAQAIKAQATNPLSRLTTVHDSISLAIDRTVDRLRPGGETSNIGTATVSMDGDLFINIKHKAQRQWQMRMSNQMSCWVASEILNTRDELRPRMFQRWIKVANICYELRNFNTLFEIMTGLSHNSVYRLKLTETLPRNMYATYENLCKIVHYSNNYGTYRVEVAEAASHGKSVIPYLGVMLRDLVAIEEGGEMVYERVVNLEDADSTIDYINDECRKSGKVNRKHINFAKLQLLARLVTDTLACQHASYDEIRPDTNLQLRLLAGMIQALDEEELNEASYRIKAPKFQPNRIKRTQTD